MTEKRKHIIANHFLAVDEHFSLDGLRAACNLTPALMGSIPGIQCLGNPAEETEHWFLDRSSSILGIAHLDTHQSLGWVGTLDHPLEPRIYCPRADDRLGVYIMLDLLPKLGIPCDVLITNHEETGGSTGGDFSPTKKYNWMFQFDRMGEDVALYDYWDDKLIQKLRIAGFKDMSRGMSTDISTMYMLGVAGFNVGCGYHDYHTEYAYINPRQLMRNLVNFMEFYRLFQKVRIPHVPARIRHLPYRGRDGWGRYHDDSFFPYLGPPREGYPIKAWSLAKGEDDVIYWKCSVCYRSLTVDFTKYPLAQEKCACGATVKMDSRDNGKISHL